MQKNFKRCLLAVMFLAPVAASAQVTIGSGKVPSEYSLLDLDTSVSKKGFHSPRLDNEQREDLIPSGTANVPAEGSLIFNTTTKCLEYWNSKEWVSLCTGDDPCEGRSFEEEYQKSGGQPNFTLCSPARVADLPVRIQWYAGLTGDEVLDTTDALAIGDHTLYAGNCEDASERISVRVKVVNCSAITPANSRVTAYTNVMYDFQSQELEAWVTEGDQPTSYQWKMSKTGRTGTYENIAGATGAIYTIQPDFIFGLGAGATADEVWFICALTNPAGTVTVSTDNALGIEFIKTKASAGADYCTLGNYGESGGVKYLDIESGNAAAGGKMRIALLSLGQSGTGSFDMGVQQQPDDAANLNDAGDLADLYQWGRIADGHEKIVWSKSATRVNQIIPMTGNGATSAVVDKAAETWSYEPYTPATAQAGQVHDTRFIAGLRQDWGRGEIAADARWGNNNATRAGAANSLTAGAGKNVWNFVNNNPCPSGWRVPSKFEQWDMYRGDGNSEVVTESGTPYADLGTSTPAGILANGWRYRAVQTNTNAIGGVIITNATGEKVFLPAVALRSGGSNPGMLSSVGSSGYYWSSTYSRGSYSMYELVFTNTFVGAGNMNGTRSNGGSVRCVADN